MIKIALKNKISKKGTALFSDGYEIVGDDEKADALIVRSADLHAAKLPKNLLAIARAGAGTNNIPLERCAENGIVVLNTPGANSNAVKELVFASIMIASRNIYEAIFWAKKLKDDVADSVEKNKSKFAGREIAGKTIGVIGLGAIGVKVANSAEALGMKAFGFDPYITIKNAHNLLPSIKIFSELDKILPLCDYVSLHIPYMKQTDSFIDKKAFSAMKKDAVLVNFSRGDIVDKKALQKALGANQIKLYITDFPDGDLVKLNNVLPIPHLGASTKESEENCAIMAAEEIIEFVENGNIINSVNYPDVNAGEIVTPLRVTAMHYNVPNVLNKLTDKLSKRNVNIGNMIDKTYGKFAYTVIDLDSRIPKSEIKKSFDFKDIIRVRILERKQ